MSEQAAEQQEAPRYMPPSEQVAVYYEQRCMELIQANQRLELQVAFQAQLIQGLISAQPQVEAEVADPPDEPPQDPEPPPM